MRDRWLNRVVVTGVGAITPLGTHHEMWHNLLAGQSGISRLDTDWSEHVPVKIAGQVRDFDPEAFLSKKDARRMSRPSQLAVATAQMAVDDANLTQADLDLIGERTSVVIGTTMGPHVLSIEMTRDYYSNGHRRPNPISFTNCLPNMPAHYVSRHLSAFGPMRTPSAACATGTQAIGEATDLIRTGKADIVIAGGVEAIVMDYIIAGFASMAALAEGYENCPQEASRPFDAQRSGFVLSEGCGLLVLESLEHAEKRQARIYAEVIGHASSADAYHIAAIEPDGKGMVRCMQWALEDGRLNPEDIHYINAHGTSTLPNDYIETAATKKVFGAAARKIPISSNKSMLGHLMAAAGGVEAIASIFSLNSGILPPTINYHQPDPECDLDYVPNTARQVRQMQYVMSNNYGLGGQNASVIFGRL